MKPYIYADNAATTKLDTDAFEAMKPYFMGEYGNASQPYSFSSESKNALKNARETVARCINAEPKEIFFTSGGSESDNWAIKGSAFASQNKEVTITSSIEHHAILNSCAFIEQLGYPVIYLPVTDKGIVEPDILEKAITEQTRLVSIMYANNEIGTIQPIKELCRIAHEHRAIFHTDAVQAVGHIKIDVKELGIDMLSASAHKFNGPKGIGFLYIKKGTSMVPFINGGYQEFGMRAGTENIPLIVGMAIALEKNVKCIDYNTLHLLEIEKYLLNQLHGYSLDFISNGSETHIPGNISLSFKNSDGEMLLHRLDLKGICVSTGSACDSVNTQISHVLKAIGTQELYAKGTIRISLGKDNTELDVFNIAKALQTLLN